MIHQYKLNGYNIVLDVFSGSVHVTDDAAYEAIRLLNEGVSRENAGRILTQMFAGQGITEQDVDEIFADIEELRRQGRLFTEDAYQDAKYDL